jgi:hypothetical protein
MREPPEARLENINSNRRAKVEEKGGILQG